MEQLPSSIPENADDYYGKDGLLYCGKCHTPKEAFFAKGIALMGKNKHPIECSCQRTERKKTRSPYQPAKAQRPCAAAESRRLFGLGNAQLDI